MTRLLNPTKKGTEVLKKYNIQLYELDKATGKTKLRSLFDIFSQLKSNDASVQDLTKLFDKIGGNAANNVFAELMKLPELIQNSIYSGGLADNIASKKQDTIKGKWDKVTSQFTETGMTVFEAYNPVIKEGLDDLVLLLKQPGTAQMFKDVATGLVALTKALVGVSMWVSENWNWLEYLVIGGVLFKKISKIVAAITPMAKGLFNTARGASALTTAIGGAGGVGSAIGGGLLAAIGEIPAIVTAAVTALASLGIGVYGAGKTTQAVSESIKKEYEKARRISPNGIIGFNIMVALKDYREHVIEAAKAGADIIVSGAGLPTELPEYLKGFKTKMAPIVSSVKSAKVILKYWDRRHNTTADMIIIEGPKAGGHLGFSVEELESELDYDNEIQGIIDVVKEYEKKYNKDIPVVVAGGISDKNKVKHAFDLGAQGVQVATRFVPTKECDADENYKKEYIKAKKEDIVIVKSPVGMPGRAIKNKFMEKVINGEKFTPKKCLGCLARCNPKEIPYCITERLIYAAKGKTDEALLFCGADAYKVNKITTVKKVFKELLEEKEV